MELPSGGTFVGQVSCNKRHTTFGPGKEEPLEYACPEEEGRVGTEHSGATHFNANYWTKDPSAVIRGCGLAIAYESDEYKVKPEDFVVISIDHKCPWKREVPFPIPAGMPPCPPGGCLCMWSWIPQAENVQQSYYLNYRCNITNADANAAPLAKPQIARKCPYNKNNCTVSGCPRELWLAAYNPRLAPSRPCTSTSSRATTTTRPVSTPRTTTTSTAST
jgi:hypothetical protein